MAPADREFSDEKSPAGAHAHENEAIQQVEDALFTTEGGGVALYESLSYGRSGFRGLVEQPYVLGAAFLASLGGFSFGYGRFLATP